MPISFFTSSMSRLPETSFLLLLAFFLSSPAFATEEDQPTSGDACVLFYGNSMVERLLEHGELEARLQIAKPSSGLRIRSFAWTGDEVGNRLRLEGYAKHMKNLIAEWPARTLVLGYGFYESFAGTEGLQEFEEHYRIHLDQLRLVHPGAKVILLSPIASEGASAERNADLELYTQSIRKLAADTNAQFIDLFSATSDAYAAAGVKLTINGIHLNEEGNRIAAKAIADVILGNSEVDPKHLHEVALAASAKHKRVAEVVRPKNAVVYFGVRARPQEYADEMPRYHKMIRLTEAVVHDLAANPGKKFSEMAVPKLSPMPEGKGRDDGKRTGIIKSVAEAMAEFEVDGNYELSLFASEEEFPELRNPVQIAFDAKGRLWVVTMPSFPHTVPGLTPPDKILILEDTNNDGKADKVTTYMQGLDALDGVAFHREGVIISEQPRLWMTKDTDGDDLVNGQGELLRGIDVTDSHHGGMIATDPMGDVIFSDGVFHRSQLETSFGVHRGMDATTYRLNFETGKITTLWQHTTPNPWNVTFDQWGNIFQTYGDGGVYDGIALPWTPFGSYHPYKYGMIAGYGKGSGTAIVSSPNFPDEYDQGMVSASLLGRYAVTLTGFNYEQGMIKPGEPVTLVSSPNAAFRPADLEFGMDGALYVSDFCSPIIGHAQHPMRDPHWDHDYGRIWKIVHKGKPQVSAIPKIPGASVGELCELLTHDQDLVRKHARIELRKHGAKAVSVVDQWIANFDRKEERFDQAALEAIFVLGGLGEVRPALLDELSKSKSFHYRAAVALLIERQADQLKDVSKRLSVLATDPHPRVQIAVINAVAQLRPTHLELGEVLNLIASDQSIVQETLKILDQGIEPAKGRSVPVLEVAPNAEMTHWLQYNPDGSGTPILHTSRKSSGGAFHLYRTFVESEIAQPAIIGINSKTLDVTVNGSLEFSQNSFWSGDQQIQVDLIPGLNVIEVELTKGRMNRGKKGLPPVFLYDAVGRALTKAKYVNDPKILMALSVQYDAEVKERGTVLRVQAAAGLQFAPTKLSVVAGTKVRLLFVNPDIMQHNFLLLKPGSVAEIGALADKMAAQPGAIEKHYIPGSDKVLVSSKLVAPQSDEKLVFQAPTTPGDYPYICTFPGHWQVMQGVLTVRAEKPKKLALPTTLSESITKQMGNGVVFETSSTATGFKKLVPPAKPTGNVVANQKTNNDPIATLTDGKLARGFGPIFGNGVKDGLYKMDLGKSQSIAAITSWSHQMSGKRGAQSVLIYGSNHPTDPGWNLADPKRFQALGKVSTKGNKIKSFTALSLRSAKKKSLGRFRWIVWQVAPISSRQENTAFQELAVEFSNEKAEVTPYALTANGTTLAAPATLNLDPKGITMLAPNLGKLSAGIRPIVRNYMILWCQAKPGSSQVEWTVRAPADGIYSVTASVTGIGSRLMANCNEQKLGASISEPGWHRIELGNLSLKTGENKILLEIDAVTTKAGTRSKPFLLSALELAKPAVRKTIRKEALAMRQQPDWFKDAGYGLMFQWTNRATPPKGPIKPWEEKINDFDLDGFISLVEDSGASYVIWSATWGNQYISAPIKSLDALISGRTTKRDLLGEMADRLHERGIRLIFYYHYGYECYHSQDTDWLKAAGGYEADKTKLFTNVMGIISEVGARYGDKLDGWWFDGGARYLNCHFDGSSADEGILTAPFKDFTAAARKGNPERLIAYNSWIKPLITDYQDYYGGEGKTGFNPTGLTNGVFNSGLQKGLQAHGCFILEGRWGHIDLNTPIPKPKFNVKQLAGFVTKARQNHYPLSINLEMYEDGSVSPASRALLKELKIALRK